MVFEFKQERVCALALWPAGRQVACRFRLHPEKDLVHKNFTSGKYHYECLVMANGTINNVYSKSL
jgi:hypothetical protein